MLMVTALFLRQSPRRVELRSIPLMMVFVSALVLLINVLQSPVANAQTQEADRSSMQDQTRQDTRQASPARTGGRVETDLSRRDAGAPRNNASTSSSTMDTSRYDATQRSSEQVSSASPAAR